MVAGLADRLHIYDHDPSFAASPRKLTETLIDHDNVVAKQFRALRVDTTHVTIYFKLLHSKCSIPTTSGELCAQVVLELYWGWHWRDVLRVFSKAKSVLPVEIPVEYPQ